jgi:hypothetical protein
VDENIFRKSVRHFFKRLGIIGRREIENAVQEALSEGMLSGTEALPIRVSLTLDRTRLMLVVDGEIELE